MNKKIINDLTKELISHVAEKIDAEEPIEPHVVKELLEKGADVNERSTFSGSKYPVFLGVLLETEWGEENTQSDIEELASLFVKHGADLNIKISGGNTPLSRCLKDYRIMSALALMQQGADMLANSDLLMLTTQIPCRNKENGKTLLNIVQRLLKCGYDAQKLTDNNKTAPIILAAEHGQIEVIKELIKHGADVNQVDDKGITPLMYACGLPVEKDFVFMQKRPLELITQLIEAGADPTIKSNKKRTALSIFKKEVELGNIYGEGDLTADEVIEKITKLLTDATNKFS